MGITAKADSNFVSAPIGMHLARCYRVIDLGTQKTSYKGTEKFLHKIMIQFEIWSEDEDGKPTLTDKGEPMSISKNYTLSLSDKAALRRDLKTWRGREFTSEELKGFELKNILGAWAMLSIVKSAGDDGKEYTNIEAVMSVPKAVKDAGFPKPHNELKMYSIDEHDDQLFETFSDRLKEKIMASPEFQGRQPSSSNRASPSAEDDSDIPF